jgi:hypothetical protein
MRPTFEMLDPTTFPNERAVLPACAAERFTASSGVLVPKATTVRPATIGETPSRRLSAVAPRTSASAPATSSAKPTSISREVKIIDRGSRKVC